MRLALTTGLNEKIEAEYNDLLGINSSLNWNLSSEANIMAIIEDELADIVNRFPGERRTELCVG